MKLPAPPTAWKHLRAILVLAHITTMVLVAIPAPVGGTNRATWKNPTAQIEFAAYARMLRVSPEDFEENLYKLAIFWMDFREIYTRPVWPYIRITGTDQPWRMFVGPDRFPPRFQVQMRTAASDYVTLYEERSSQFEWHEEFFRQERVRSYVYRYAWPEYSNHVHQNCSYLARRVFAEKADATAVRCRYWRQKSPSAAEVIAKTPLEPGGWVAEAEVAR